MKFDIILEKGVSYRQPFSWLADGEPYDISTAAIRMIVSGFAEGDALHALVPEVDPNNATGRLFHFTKEHAAALSYKPVGYKVVITQSGEDFTLFRGRISAEDF